MAEFEYKVVEASTRNQLQYELNTAADDGFDPIEFIQAGVNVTRIVLRRKVKIDGGRECSCALNPGSCPFH